MTSEAPDTPRPDPHLADAIARAERGRAMLERLAVMGMEIAEEVREQHRTAHLHPAPKHDLRRGYDRVARAVTLTLALIRVFEADLLAMRKGEPIKVRPLREAKPSPEVSAPQSTWTPPAEPAQPSPLQAKVRSSVWGAINQEVRHLPGPGSAGSSPRQPYRARGLRRVSLTPLPGLRRGDLFGPGPQPRLEPVVRRDRLSGDQKRERSAQELAPRLAIQRGPRRGTETTTERGRPVRVCDRPDGGRDVRPP